MSLGVDIDEKLIRALESGRQVVLVTRLEDRTDRTYRSPPKCRSLLAEVAEPPKDRC
jgi:hypothetical protein